MALVEDNLGSASLLAFARELHHAESHADLLAMARAEIVRALGERPVWLYVAERDDPARWLLLAETKEPARPVDIQGDAVLSAIARSRSGVTVSPAETRPDRAFAGQGAVLYAALRVDDASIGALGVGIDGVGGGLSDDARGYFEELGRQLAAAVTSTRRFTERVRAGRVAEEALQEVERSAARMQLLAESSQEFARATPSFEVLLDVIARRLSALVGELCSIRLLSEDGQSLAPGIHVHHPDPEVTAIARLVVVPQRLGEGISGKVAASGEGVLVPRIATADLVARTPEKFKPFVERLGVTSLLVVPLRSKGSILGVISMTRSGASAPYTNDDLVLAQDLADRAALAIDNARLLADLEVRVAERTADIAEAHRELEAFSYSVAHDLRAPLRTMNGFASALLEDYADSMDETAKDHLTRIVDGASRMAETIDALLGLSKMARANPSRRRVDLGEMARAIVQGLQGADPNRDVRFVTTGDLTAFADPRLLRSMLENLLGNSWKFTKKRERAHIELGRVDDAAVPTFFVKDDGAGFDMAYVDKLFLPFRRLHAESEFEGSGVGLAIVERIVRRHGGRIWAEAAVGEGAAFYFTLS